MAATARLLRTSAPLKLNPSFSHSTCSSCISNGSSRRCVSMLEKKFCENGDSKSKVAVKASPAYESILSTMEQQTRNTFMDLPSVLADIAGAAVDTVFKPLVKVKRHLSWKRLLELLIEKGVIDCRFFTMFAVAGSLLGSVLCFVQGFFLILESYMDYFRTISNGSDEGHVVQLVIEAIDMFLAGGAMLVFGIGLYVMFVGTSKIQSKSGGLLSGSNFFGLFHLKRVPAWMGMQSVSHAKSQIGRSVLMMLQVIDRTVSLGERRDDWSSLLSVLFVCYRSPSLLLFRHCDIALGQLYFGMVCLLYMLVMSVIFQACFISILSFA